MTAMDLRVSQAVVAARLLERAFHDFGPWTISCLGTVAPAVRMIAEDRIVFRAHFPDLCIIADEVTASLICRGVPVSVRSVERPDEDGEFNLEWVIPLPSAQNTLV